MPLRDPISHKVRHGLDSVTAHRALVRVEFAEKLSFLIQIHHFYYKIHKKSHPRSQPCHTTQHFSAQESPVFVEESAVMYATDQTVADGG